MFLDSPVGPADSACIPISRPSESKAEQGSTLSARMLIALGSERARHRELEAFHGSTQLQQYECATKKAWERAHPDKPTLT